MRNNFIIISNFINLLFSISHCDCVFPNTNIILEELVVYKKFLILILFLLFLSGCKEDSQLVEPHKMSQQFFETMTGQAQQGIYMINTSKKQSFIYRGIEKGII